MTNQHSNTTLHVFCLGILWNFDWIIFVSTLNKTLQMQLLHRSTKPNLKCHKSSHVRMCHIYAYHPLYSSRVYTHRHSGHFPIFPSFTYPYGNAMRKPTRKESGRISHNKLPSARLFQSVIPVKFIEVQHCVVLIKCAPLCVQRSPNQELQLVWRDDDRSGVLESRISILHHPTSVSPC